MIRWGDPALTDLLAGAYLGLLTLLWSALTLGVGAWARRWTLARREQGQTVPPVTVCVPARNEEGNIGRCVGALLASEGVDLELIVIDDASTDGTAAEARAAAGDDARFQLRAGRPPAPGWSGKAWALAQAAADADRPWILFLDADVTVHPRALLSCLAQAEAERLDLLSLFGTWSLESFWERVLIPVVGWVVRAATDLDAVNDPSRPDAFANGQLILVRRAAYERVGGHRAVREEVLDDVRLAQAFKRVALRIQLLHAPWAFRARLYRSLGEIVRGYVKNFYEGMGRRPLVALGLALFTLVGSLLPFLIVAVVIAARLAAGWVLLDLPMFAWCVGVCGLIMAFRWRQERLGGRSGWYALTQPLGNLILAWVVLRSMAVVEVEWKGRRFKDGRAQHDAGAEGTGTDREA
ncbi:MAG: glycosyltransferase family 2 protein [Pseudomonadota bacterium]